MAAGSCFPGRRLIVRLRCGPLIGIRRACETHIGREEEILLPGRPAELPAASRIERGGVRFAFDQGTQRDDLPCLPLRRRGRAMVPRLLRTMIVVVAGGSTGKI